MGFDVWDMDTHRQVKRGFALVERLRDDPWSRWRAEALGGAEWVGWDSGTFLLAALVNAAHTQLKGKKLRDSEMVTVPKVKKKKRAKFDPKAPVSSMDMRSLLPEGW